MLASWLYDSICGRIQHFKNMKSVVIVVSNNLQFASICLWYAISTIPNAVTNWYPTLIIHI